MNRPDPHVAAAIERNAREYAIEAAPPPADVADAAAYLAWLRDRAARAAGTPVRPKRDRKYLDRPQPARNRQPGAVAGARVYRPRSDAYGRAAAKLMRYPDCGAASVSAARAVLGDRAPYEDLVLHAAEHPVIPLPVERTPEPGAAAAPARACAGCGAVLDPDGTCFVCPPSGAGITMGDKSFRSLPQTP
ncbi:hypothetical protein ACFHW2_11575 [Actinomadura sp. LOL_016]|uniref:hypothetical protein n=1 Tax=unclassified Actinomadura TaxID=2626254 RepID=UPI003A802B29